MRNQNIWHKLSASAALIGCIVGLVGWVIPVSESGKFASIGIVGGVIWGALFIYSRISAKPRPLRAQLNWVGSGGGSFSEGNRRVVVEANSTSLLAQAVGADGCGCKVWHERRGMGAEVVEPGGEGLFVGVGRGSLVVNRDGTIYKLNLDRQGGKLIADGIKAWVRGKCQVRVEVRGKQGGRVVVEISGDEVRLTARVTGLCEARLLASSEGGTLFAESSPAAEPGLLQAGSTAKKREIDQMDPEALRALEATLNDRLNRRATSQVEREGRHNFLHRLRVIVMATFCAAMVFLTVYNLIASTQITHPLPAWEWFGKLRGGRLFWVGGGVGVVAVIVGRFLVLRFTPDRVDQERIRRLGQRFRAIRWVNLLLGEIPIISVVGVFCDLALGYLVAQGLASALLHGGGPLVFAATVTLMQMPFGGIFYLIRNAALFGLPSREEREYRWVEGKLRTLSGGGGPHNTWKGIFWLWWIVLGGTPMVYLVILIILIHWPNQNAAQAALIGLTTLAGVASGLFFGLVASWLARRLREGAAGANSGKAQDLGTTILGSLGNLSPLAGLAAVLLWGRGYTAGEAALLSAVYQQIGGVIVSSIAFLYMVRMQAARRQLAVQAGYPPVPAPTPPLPPSPASAQSPAGGPSDAATVPQASYPPVPAPTQPLARRREGRGNGAAPGGASK